MNFWQLVMLMVWFAVFVLWVFIVITTFVDLLRNDGDLTEDEYQLLKAKLV